MKKSLILAVIMVSVTSFAGTLRVKCDAGKDNHAANTFSGVVNLTPQADEAVLADSFLSTIRSQKGALAQLLILENMQGTRQKIEAGLLGKSEVTSIELQTGEESSEKAYLIMNFGMKGLNARLVVNNEAIYSSTCSVTSAASAQNR